MLVAALMPTYVMMIYIYIHIHQSVNSHALAGDTFGRYQQSMRLIVSKC